MAVQGSSDVLIDELYETTNRLRQFVEGRLREKGASVARLRALRMLARARQPLRMRDLSDMAGIAARTATAIVDSLERDGLVERVRHPTTGARSCCGSRTRGCAATARRRRSTASP